MKFVLIIPASNFVSYFNFNFRFSRVKISKYNFAYDTLSENQKKYNAEIERKHKEEAERGMYPGGGSHSGGADPAEELAKKLGKRASEADQTNRKTLEHYFKI